MAKKEADGKSVTVVTDATVAAVLEKGDELLSLRKYFARYNPAVHRYTRAYLEPQYYGMLKTAAEWQSLTAASETKKVEE